MGRFFHVGKIVNTHGIRGEVRVISITDFPESRFKKGAKLYLFLPGKKEGMELEVESWRRHKQFDLLSFKGYNSINEVEAFKGGVLKVPEEQLAKLPEGEYYFHEIIGCKVWTADGEEIGTVREILTPGANDVWVVQSDKKVHYIPYIGEVVKSVDVKEKRVIIEPMEGLLD